MTPRLFDLATNWAKWIGSFIFKEKPFDSHSSFAKFETDLYSFWKLKWMYESGRLQAEGMVGLTLKHPAVILCNSPDWLGKFEIGDDNSCSDSFIVEKPSQMKQMPKSYRHLFTIAHC